MDWAATDLGERDLYKLLVNTVLPRPIALVTTIDENDHDVVAGKSILASNQDLYPLILERLRAA